jgi:hypothetical protein
MPSSGSIGRTRVAEAGILSVLCGCPGLLDPEGDGTTVFHNVSNCSPSNTFHPRRIYHEKRYCGNSDVT